MPLALVFTFISCSKESADNNTAGTNLIQNYTYSTDETALADAINEYRVSTGRNALQTINHISYKAEEHNEYMIEKNSLNHDYFEERSQNIIAVLGAVKVNENVAYNYSTANAVLHAWLESPDHKANIEGDFTDFGISIRTDPENGNKYYTNIFIKR